MAVLPAVEIVLQVILVIPLDHRGGKALFSPQFQPSHQVPVDGAERLQPGVDSLHRAAAGGLPIDAPQLLLLALGLAGLDAHIDRVAPVKTGEGNRHRR